MIERDPRFEDAEFSLFENRTPIKLVFTASQMRDMAPAMEAIGGLGEFIFWAISNGIDVCHDLNQGRKVGSIDGELSDNKFHRRFYLPRDNPRRN